MSHVNRENPETEGIIPRSARQLFQQIEQVEDEFEYSIRIQLLQIYMEVLSDLLCPTKVPMIREDPEFGVFVAGAESREVFSADELLEVYEQV